MYVCIMAEELLHTSGRQLAVLNILKVHVYDTYLSKVDHNGLCIYINVACLPIICIT